MVVPFLDGRSTGKCLWAREPTWQSCLLLRLAKHSQAMKDAMKEVCRMLDG